MLNLLSMKKWGINMSLHMKKGTLVNIMYNVRMCSLKDKQKCVWASNMSFESVHGN